MAHLRASTSTVPTTLRMHFREMQVRKVWDRAHLHIREDGLVRRKMLSIVLVVHIAHVRAAPVYKAWDRLEVSGILSRAYGPFLCSLFLLQLEPRFGGMVGRSWCVMNQVRPAHFHSFSFDFPALALFFSFRLERVVGVQLVFVHHAVTRAVHAVPFGPRCISFVRHDCREMSDA